MATENTDLSVWATPQQIAAEFPEAFPLKTLRRLLRADIRQRNGFHNCVRFITPRRPLIHRGRLNKYLDTRAEGGVLDTGAD